jgi:membrane-bound lytic murein transglycosylase D
MTNIITQVKKINTSYRVLFIAATVIYLSACQTLMPDQQSTSEIPDQVQVAEQESIVLLPTKKELVADVSLQPEINYALQLPMLDTIEANDSQAVLLEPASDSDPENADTTDDNTLVSNEIAKQAESALQRENTAWTRLQQGMQMQSVMNSRVQIQLDWYLKHREYLDRVMTRAEPMLPFILDELEKKNLPTELALLPIVESAYQSFAYSHGRASGMWQIIPSTGRHLGLKQNWWYDGRRDIIESTKAATKYLQNLAGQFNQDWELALASYNAGPGKVRSAIRYNRKKGRPTDFWHLTKLRPETKFYVPKLLALKELFSNPEKYNLELLHIEDEQGYGIVELDSQIDLALAADLAGITTEELYQLNPAFNRWATAPNGPHRLLLPKESVEKFNAGLAKLPKQKRINWVRYKIKNGDTLSVISQRYRTSTKLIKRVNNIRGTSIRAGKYLLIPTATRSLKQYSLSQTSRLNKIKNTSHIGQKITHTVKSGESFWSISRHYGVKTNSLAKWNGMAPIDTLKVGQKLVIWKRTSSSAQRVSLFDRSPSHKMHALRYTVRKGDSLSRIADKFNLRVADIKKWNKVGKYLRPGQKLKLYVDITSQSG